MRQRDRRLFVQRCTALITDLGGVRSEGMYEWGLQTRYGRLELNVRENTTSGPGTVFTRFVDAKAALPQTGCNQYSGKWNHYWFEGTVDYALKELEHRLKAVMPVAHVGAPLPLSA